MEKKKDVLNREEFVNTITEFVHTLSDLKRGCSFAIDGKWGSGKTFLLEMLEDRLREQQSETTADNQYFLFHYNCWQYDYYDEPTVAMVSSLLDSIKEEEKFFGGKIDENIQPTLELVKKEVKKVAEKFIENRIGVNLISIVDDVKNKKQELEKESRSFDNLFRFKETLDQTRESLRKIAEKKTLVFVVDELDRCIPSYAIKVLERLHHLFSDLDNVIVIIAVDGGQLEHSIKEIYGPETCVKEYLKKFISLTFKLDIGKLSEGIFEKYQDYFTFFSKPLEKEKKEVEEFFSVLWEGIDIRSQEQAMEKVRTVHKLIAKEESDLTLAVFEIFLERFQLLPQHLMRRIATISRGMMSNENKLDEKYKEYLSDLQRKNRKNQNNYFVEMKDTVMGRFFELMNEVYQSDGIDSCSVTTKHIKSKALAFKNILDIF